MEDEEEDEGRRNILYNVMDDEDRYTNRTEKLDCLLSM